MRKHYAITVLAFITILWLTTGQIATATEPEPPAPLPAADIRMLARVVWGEARGCSPDEQRLVCWTVFQRVDAGGWYGSTIKEVVTKRAQFNGYRSKNPVESDIYDLCAEEAQKWIDGESPPTLAPYAPTAPYYFFDGDGVSNWFREVW